MEILDSLLCHRQREKASFHMPGHKNGAAFAGTKFENAWLGLDVTEVEGTDCLCHPRGAILKSQQWAAELYGATRAYYLVNGSSCGILSMFYAFFREGDRVLTDRSAHRSVVNALALCGVEPIYLAPKLDAAHGVPKGISASAVRRALEEDSEIRGIFITSPNYYGFTSEIAEIACAAHERGIPLLVDEAHGAHFPFDERFPINAVRQGADAAVVSLHKSLPCPNQTALLLLRTDEKAAETADAVNTFQTTSPSYVLLVYMEAALEFAAKNGREQTDRLFARTEPFAKYRTDDPFKLLLNFEKYGLSGYAAEKILREEFGIYAELADAKNVLLMTSWGNRDEDFDLLAAACEKLCVQHGKPIKSSGEEWHFPKSRPALSPRTVRSVRKQWIPAENAAGRISAASVTAFPPCIPILLPGEIITKEQIQSIRMLMENGRTADGLWDGKICVTEESKRGDI